MPFTRVLLLACFLPLIHCQVEGITRLMLEVKQCPGCGLAPAAPFEVYAIVSRHLLLARERARYQNWVVALLLLGDQKSSLAICGLNCDTSTLIRIITVHFFLREMSRLRLLSQRDPKRGLACSYAFLLALCCPTIHL